MSIQSVTNRRPGRPPRSDIDILKAKCWFWAVARRLGSSSGYALEKYFMPEKMTSVNGVTKPSYIFNTYKRGEHTPSPAQVELVERKAPGTTLYIEHPFWEVARTPCTDLDSLYNHLLLLRPEITRLLFYPPRREGVAPMRRERSYMSTFDILRKEGDWDALTACIGLIQEAKYYGDKWQYISYTRQTFSVFRRFVSQYPFSDISYELYTYLIAGAAPDCPPRCQQLTTETGEG